MDEVVIASPTAPSHPKATAGRAGLNRGGRDGRSGRAAKRFGDRHDPDRYQTIATRGNTRYRSQEFMNDEGFSSSRLHMPRPVWLDAWLLPRREQAAEVWREKKNGDWGQWEQVGAAGGERTGLEI